MFAGFLVALSDPGAGFLLGSSSLYVDVPATLLLGLGLLRLARQAKGGQADWASASSVLLLAWVVLTVLWRWLLPATLGAGYADLLDAILGSEGGTAPLPGGWTLALDGMLILWIVASFALAAAALLLRLDIPVGSVLLEPRMDLRSWEGFALLNAAGTFLVALQLLVIVHGGTSGLLLTEGLVVKVAAVPLNGIFSYGLLARRSWRVAAKARRARAKGRVEANP